MDQTIQEYQTHFDIARRQRSKFNLQRKYIKQDEVMVIMDFKENIKLGGGPAEENQAFYSRQQCSVLGCAIVFYNPETRKRKTAYVDYFSDVLSHDGVFVEDCITHLVQNIKEICPQLKDIQINRFNFWTDVGLHFRCKEVAHFLLVKVPATFQTSVNWDAFAECHGKSIVDGHFWLMSNWIKKIEKVKKIDSIQCLMTSLEEKVNTANEFKEPNKKLMSKFYSYHQSERAEKIQKLEIPNIASYYHFEYIYHPDSKKVYIGIKMLSDSVDYITEGANKIKITEHSEKRKAKLGSIKTEERKKQKVCSETIELGPITSRKLRAQKKHL